MMMLQFTIAQTIRSKPWSFNFFCDCRCSSGDWTRNMASSFLQSIATGHHAKCGNAAGQLEISDDWLMKGPINHKPSTNI